MYRLNAACATSVLAFFVVNAIAGDPVFDHGFETPCPIYYADADGDGFGDPDGFTQTCDAQPPDTVVNADDCDDGNGDINPDAVELTPDASYVDENCDGVDGDVDLAVFVSQLEGDDTLFCGSIDEPCFSLAKGYQRTKEIPVQQIYLQEANYFESLDIDQPVAVFGGYAPGDWSRAFRTVNQSRINGFFNDVRNYTARVVGVSAEFHNLWLVGPGTPQTAADLNSYVIIADTGSTILIRDSQLDQGTAANGATGDPGTSASQVAADSGNMGATGLESALTCDTERADGGLRGMNPSATNADGGDGGDGGSMDTTCVAGVCAVIGNCDARSGVSGSSAEMVSGQFGTGGPGGAGTETCGPGFDGWPGAAATNGNGGAGGVGGSFIGGFWVSAPGQAGQPGTDGGGGGGGGGAGGCDIGIDSRGSGGGGGGAGGAAADSVGQGGEGGGGSFGAYLTDSTLITFDTVFARGNGGKGGMGGESGLGQPGGDGGPGGPAVGDSMVAGDGGDGADGGNSGAGGGGAGGSSCAIVDINSTVTLNNTSITGGGAGLGGLGGSGTSNSAGSPGDPGALCEILEP